jgi:hypothetical protein
MNHAEKLNYNIDLSFMASSIVSPHHRYEKEQRYSRNLPGNSCGFSKTKTISNADDFIDQLPPELLALERPHAFLLELPATDLEDPVLPAHVDYNKTCGINLYLDGDQEVTKFYNWNREQRQSEYLEEFCAKAGEVWLMDTSVPHSVSLTRNKTRSILTFSFTKLKYNEVLECFKTKQY